MSCQTCGRSRNDVGQSLYTFGRIFAAVEGRSHAILYFSRVFNHFTWLESGIVSQDGQRFHCWRNRTTFDAFIEPGGGNIQWYNPGTCRKWHASSLSSWKGLQTWALTMAVAGAFSEEIFSWIDGLHRWIYRSKFWSKGSTAPAKGSLSQPSATSSLDVLSKTKPL